MSNTVKNHHQTLWSLATEKCSAYIVVVGSVVAGLLFVYLTLQGEIQLPYFQYIINKSLPDGFSFESKVSLFVKMSWWTSLLVFGLITVTMISRSFLGQSSPVCHEDYGIVRCLSRCLTNQTEQSVLFILNLGIWIFIRATYTDRKEAVEITLIQIFGQIQYMVAYLVGSRGTNNMIKLTGAFGFSISTSSIIVLFIRNLGFKIL